jgi:hypothetical protein
MIQNKNIQLFSPSDKQPKWQLVVFFSYCVLFLWFKLSFHELWKDEWQAWHVARDMSWGQMFAFLYYEGHPSLWYIYLKIITLITPKGADLIGLQLGHSAVSLSAMALLFLRFRFSLGLKIALLLGYFVCFEYGMVNRGYALVMLLTFCAAILLKDTTEHFEKICVAIFLLCQTEAQGVIVAGTILFYCLAQDFSPKNMLTTLKNTKNQGFIAAFILGLLIFVVSVFPRGEAEDLARAYNMSKQPLSEGVGIAFQGLLANTFCIGSINDTGAFGISILGIIISISVLLSIVYLLKDDKVILATMIVTWLAFFLFATFVFSGGVRQWGILFLVFILILQLLAQRKQQLHLTQQFIIIVFVTFQCYYNALAWQKEYYHPFSNAKKAAEFLSENTPERVPIVAINPFETGAVVGYLGQSRKVYQMPSGEPFTWFKWLSKVYIPTESELKLFADYKKVGGVILLTHTLLPQNRFPNAQLWKSYEDFSLKNEKFYIYQLKR